MWRDHSSLRHQVGGSIKLKRMSETKDGYVAQVHRKGMRHKSRAALTDIGAEFASLKLGDAGDSVVRVLQFRR